MTTPKIATLTLLALCACGGDPFVAGELRAPDAADGSDAGGEDAGPDSAEGRGDALPGADAGQVDAPTGDAGVDAEASVDSGLVEADPPDAGPEPAPEAGPCTLTVGGACASPPAACTYTICGAGGGPDCSCVIADNALCPPGEHVAQCRYVGSPTCSTIVTCQ